MASRLLSFIGISSNPPSNTVKSVRSKSSLMWGGFIRYVRSPPDLVHNLIKPPHIKADLDLTDLTVLDGGFEDIPMKDKSLDAIVAVDVQDSENLEASCKEFRRVLRNGGILVGCTPFMGLGGANDPLDVGEFMKKAKYILSGRPYLDTETVKKAVARTL